MHSISLTIDKLVKHCLEPLNCHIFVGEGEGILEKSCNNFMNGINKDAKKNAYLFLPSCHVFFQFCPLENLTACSYWYLFISAFYEIHWDFLSGFYSLKLWFTIKLSVKGITLHYKQQVYKLIQKAVISNFSMFNCVLH